MDSPRNRAEQTGSSGPPAPEPPLRPVGPLPRTWKMFDSSPTSPRWPRLYHEPIRSLPRYDALLIVGFGGPEKREDVIPFLENVLRGRNVPRERMLEVAEHYYHFGGVSPINAQVRDLIAALTPELRRHGVDLPIYWGNRNWHPMLADTMAAMKTRRRPACPGRRPGGVQLVFELPAVSRGYRQGPGGRRRRGSGGRQDAGLLQPPRLHRRQRRPRPRGPRIGFPAGRESAHLAFTAHSIPASMAANCDYEKQLTRDLPTRRRGRRRSRRALAARLPEPQRPPARPLARSRTSSTTCGRCTARGRDRRRRPPRRLPLGPHGSALRPRRGGRSNSPSRSACTWSAPRPSARTRVRRHAPRADRRADESASPTGPPSASYPASHDVCPVDCCLPAVGEAAGSRATSLYDVTSKTLDWSS